MRVAWAEADRHLQVRDVMELLDDDLAYTTVMTVMNRLYEKGMLRRRRKGRAWAYRPATTREAYAAATMADALRVADNRSAVLLHFVADLGPDEAAQLRRLLGPDGGSADGR